MDLRTEVQMAVRRGELDAAFAAWAEERLTAGDVESVIYALQQRGVLDGGGASFQSELSVSHAESIGASHVDASAPGDGRWGVQHEAVGAPEISQDVLSRAAALKETHVGESRPPTKYELDKEIARGGVGAIHLVRDLDLMRTLVMKTLIPGQQVSDYVLQKFVEEAQITAQLEHPNIVPVHDFGHFNGGEIFFTMKLVQGRTLKEIVTALRKGESETIVEFPRIKLLGVFQQVCMAIAFANSRGVVHRDIKSSNVMVGEYGETLVLDWGIAKVIGRAEIAADESAPAVETMRSQSDDATMMGVVTGTPAYMSPEQAAGRVDAVDARSDVYALGALLYEILCFRAPFRGKNFRQTLAQVLTTPPVPPSQRAPQNNVPPMLEAVALKCLEKRPEDRYQSAREVSEQIELYLAGVEDLDRRARLSEAKLQEGIELGEAYVRTRATVEALRGELMDLEWHIQGFEPVEEKRAVWAKQAELAEHQAQMHQEFSAATQGLMAAVGFNPNNDEASNELARLYWMRLRDAEQENDEGEVVYYRGLVEAYNRGLFDELLRGEGRLSVRSSPLAARVSAARFMELDLQLSVLMEEELGHTPLNNIPLGNGSWLFTLHLDGYRDVVCPGVVERGEVTDLNFQLYTEEEIGEHFLLVPGGAFVMGGDETCASSRHRRVVDVDDLFVARYPVTCGEYLAFLNDLLTFDPAQAEARVPRIKAHGGFLWYRGPSGWIEMPTLDDEGFAWDPYWPVIGVSFEDAEAYCAWYTERAQIPVRLPTEAEWEKTARGADARLFPWGNRFDATFCKMAYSRPGEPRPERVGSFPVDCSPYGVLDLAGGVAEYVDTEFAGDPTLRLVKGGHYASTSDIACRATQRLPVSPGQPSIHHGFRVVRPPPEPVGGTPRRRLIRPKF